MHYSCFFRARRSIQAFQGKRWLFLRLATFMFLSSLFFLPPPVHSAQKHGCAPGTPPPVSGTPVTAPSTPGSVVVNEVLSLPESNWNCSEPSGVFSQAKDSWIELYNTQNQAFNLYAAHAEVSLDGGTNWYHLPLGAAIGAGNFLVIFPEESLLASNPQWTVILVVGGTVIDQASVPALEPDQSYARVPDASSHWQYVGQPTIDASNNGSDQPITPTPVKTVKPTQTPGVGTTGGGGANTNTPIGSGTQPAWSGVQLPPGATPVPTSDAFAASPSYQQPGTPAARDSGQDSWPVIVVVACALLLLGALFWYWRLARSP